MGGLTDELNCHVTQTSNITISFTPLFSPSGIKSSTHVVMVALKRAPSDLSAHQKKILQIDDHCGIAIAGLTADARILSRFMRMECLNERYAYDRPMPVTRLVGKVGAKSQIPTQVSSIDLCRHMVSL